MAVSASAAAGAAGAPGPGDDTGGPDPAWFDIVEEASDPVCLLVFATPELMGWACFVLAAWRSNGRSAGRSGRARRSQKDPK